jgi:hypothetical protein
MRVGVVRNPASHANRKRPRPAPEGGDVLFAQAPSATVMAEVLADFARRDVGLVVLEGGDGSLRDMITALPAAFGEAQPLLGVVPAGKTNLLARDLGLASLDTLPLDRLLAAAREPVAPERLKVRRALEVKWTAGDRPAAHGFFFGAAAFRRATDMAQTVHSLGAFQRPAIAMTLAGVLAKVLTGGPEDPWRAGEAMRLQIDGRPQPEGRRFLFLASTLKRFPLRFRPFGATDGGLRYLDVDAPPPRLPAAIPAMMRDEPPAWLEAAGYRQGGGERFDLFLDQAFILDGEHFPGGELSIQAGPPLRFVAS